MLKRNLGREPGRLSGLQTPPETESEASGPSEDGDVEEGQRAINEQQKEQTNPIETGKENVVENKTKEEAYIKEALDNVELD